MSFQYMGGGGFRTIGQTNFARRVKPAAPIPSYGKGYAARLAQSAPNIGQPSGPPIATTPFLGDFGAAPTGASNAVPAGYDLTGFYQAAGAAPGGQPQPGTTAQYTGQTGQSTDAPAGQSIDYSGDPILSRIQAMQVQGLGNTVASADVARRRLLTDYGDPTLARQTTFGGPADNYLGVADTQQVGDENTALAAQGNPNSTLAQLAARHGTRQLGINEGANKQNLLFSSALGDWLGKEQKQYGGEQAYSAGQVQDALGSLSGQVLQGYAAAEAAKAQAEQDAYVRALQAQLAGAGAPVYNINYGAGSDPNAPPADPSQPGAGSASTGYGDPRVEDIAHSTGATIPMPTAQPPKPRPKPNAYNRPTVANLH